MTGEAVSAAHLATIHAAGFTHERPWTEAEFAALLSQPGTLVLGGQGAFVLGRVTLDEAEILTVATHPDHRRRGLARQRLREFETAARGKGAVKVFLEVAEDNPAAIALYSASGYHEAGRRAGYYRRPGQPAAAALVLEKPLGPA